MTLERRPVAGREVVAAERPALSAFIDVGALITGLSNIEAFSARAHDLIWADPKEDRMTNHALFFSRFSAQCGPREPRERPRSEHLCMWHRQSAPETDFKYRSCVLRVFGANIEARFAKPHGLTRG